MHRVYHYWSAVVGWRGPQVDIQVTPFQWQLGIGYSTERVTVAIGPMAAVLWYRFLTPFECSVAQGKH